MAGLVMHKHFKSRQGRKVLAHGHHFFCRPSRDLFYFADVFPSVETLGYFQLHPDNCHVRDKIRQQLQVLRDAKLLVHVSSGSWCLP